MDLVGNALVIVTDFNIPPAAEGKACVGEGASDIHRTMPVPSSSWLVVLLNDAAIAVGLLVANPDLRATAPSDSANGSPSGAFSQRAAYGPSSGLAYSDSRDDSRGAFPETLHTCEP